MTTTRSTNWAALAVSLLVLIAGSAALVLNPVGLTAAVQGFEYQSLSRIFPAAAASAPPPLVSTSDMNVGVGRWLTNLAVLWPQILFALAAGLGIAALLSRGRGISAMLFMLLAIAAGLGADWLLFTRAHLFLPMLAACFVLVLTWAVGLLAAGLQPTKRDARRRVYPDRPVSAEAVAEAPVRTAELPEAHGERRSVTYVAGRLGGLSELAGALEPEGLADLARSVVNELAETIVACGGVLLPTNGDRLAALWTGGGDDPDPAAHACDAALRVSLAFSQIQDQHGEGTPYERLQMGIGIATGSAIVIGKSGNRAPAAVVGECVERADELSLLCGRYGPAILTDGGTRDMVESSFATLEVDAVALPSGDAAKIYALYGNPLVRASPKFRALSTFHDHLFHAIRERRWGDARTLIDQCGKLSGAIPKLYDLHLARIGWYESHPPQADWDGAFRPPIV